MQPNMPTAVLYSDAILRKSLRAGVAMPALAQRLYRNELLVPLLHQPGSLQMIASSCPTWRVHLHAVSNLNHWHSLDAMLAFVRERADVAHPGPEGDAQQPSPLDTVGSAIAELMDWWRQPKAREVLALTSEAELWAALVSPRQRAHDTGGSAGGKRSPASKTTPLTDLLDSLDRAQLAHINDITSRDVLAFLHLFKLTLSQVGCLSSEATSPESFFSQALSLTPGCAPLRDFLRSPAGRKAYLSQHARADGLSGVFLRWMARLTLLIRALRDAALLAMEATLVGCRWYWRGMFRSSRSPDQPPPPLNVSPSNASRNQTLFEWMSNTDPWTVFGTSVAAVLAVLRVMVRLTSAFSTAASLTPPLKAPSTPPAAAESPSPAALPAPSAPAQTSRRHSKKSAKGRQKQRQKQPAPSRISVPPAASPQTLNNGQQAPAASTPTAASTSAAAALLPASNAVPEVIAAPKSSNAIPPPVLDQFDAVAGRLRVPSLDEVHLPEGPLSGPLPDHVTSELQTAFRPPRLAFYNPGLAASIRGILPPMLLFTAHEVKSDASATSMLSKQLAARAQLQLMQKLGVQSKEGMHDDSLPGSGNGEHFIPCETTPSNLTLDAPQMTDIDLAAAVPEDDVLPLTATSPELCGKKSGPQLSTAEQELSAKLQMYHMEECGAIPELFLCPISRELMESPVLAMDGHIYERNQIESWLRNHRTSPMTNMGMGAELAPVLSLRSEIQSFKQRFPHLL